jgi:hypothetical protein
MMVKYGDTPVPWGSMWSDEDEYYVGKCPWFGVPAIMQKQAQGSGTPRFGSPHVERQRKLHARCLCDICAKPLKGSTKLTLSTFGEHIRDGQPLTVYEPLIHVECAKLCLHSCPSLKRQLDGGWLRVRRVTRYRARPTEALQEHLEKFVPEYKGPPIAGLAVVDITAWQDVTAEFAC